MNYRSKDAFGNSQALKTGDKRSYIVKLKKKTELTKDDLHKYYEKKSVELGKMEITWIGSFGDRDIFHTDTFVYKQKEGVVELFSAKVVNPPSQLILEEPLTLTVRITNMSKEQYSLKIGVNKDDTKAIAINSFTPKVSSLSNSLGDRKIAIIQ